MDIKLMKIAGYVGLGLLAINFILFFLPMIGININIGLPSVIAIIFMILLVLAFLTFYYGFFILGKEEKSWMLKFASLSTIFSIVAIVLIFIFIILSSKIFYIAPESLAGGLAMSPSSLGISIVIWIFLLLVILFLIVVQYIFSIALIKIDDVKFAKIAGILNLIYIILGSLVFLLIIYAMINPDAVLNFIFSIIFSGNNFYLVLYKIFGIVFSLFSLAVLLFESLALLNASEKFE